MIADIISNPTISNKPKYKVPIPKQSNATGKKLKWLILLKNNIYSLI